MRLFAAVALDEHLRRAAERTAETLRAQLRATRLDARWVSAENLHFTLVFIGHVDEDAAQQFIAAVERPFARAPFPVRLGGCGVFPPSGPPRVIWIGLEQGADPLRGLQTEVVARLQPLGFEPERRPFSAHLTLARVKDLPRSAARDVRAIVTGATATDAQCIVTRVTLFRSHLSPKGSRYEAIAQGALTGPPA